MIRDSQLVPDKAAQVGTDVPKSRDQSTNKRSANIYNQELLKLASVFRALNDRLDRMVDAESPGEEPALMNLHREWADVCSRAAALPASSSEARRAKAAMLMTVLEIVAPADGTREPHEILAESIARDLLR